MGGKKIYKTYKRVKKGPKIPDEMSTFRLHNQNKQSKSGSGSEDFNAEVDAGS